MAPAVVGGGVIVNQHEGVGEYHQAAEQEPAHELDNGNRKYVEN